VFPTRTTRFNVKKIHYGYRMYLYVFLVFLPKEKQLFLYVSEADWFYNGDGMCFIRRATVIRKKRIQGKASWVDCLQRTNIRLHIRESRPILEQISRGTYTKWMNLRFSNSLVCSECWEIPALFSFSTPEGVFSMERSHIILRNDMSITWWYC
jgi:hypothetical protein